APPREGVPLGREAGPLPDEDLPLPVERGLRGLEGLLLDTGLGELDLEELPLPLDRGLLELLDVPAGAGDRLLPPGDLLLLGREAPPFRARLVELLRHAARLPRQQDRGGLHLFLILRALRFLVLKGLAQRGGLPLPPFDLLGLRLDGLVAGLEPRPLAGRGLEARLQVPHACIPL